MSRSSIDGVHIPLFFEVFGHGARADKAPGMMGRNLTDFQAWVGD